MSRPATRRPGVLTALVCAVSLAACTGNGDGDDTTPTPPAVPPTVAATTATSVLAALGKASVDVTATGDAARAAVFVGPALESANAKAKLLPGRTPAERAAVELETGDAKVLAISRGQQRPHQLLVHTSLKQSGGAVLVLLVSEQAGDDFKAAAVAPLLPGATVDALDPLAVGSAPIGDASGLAASPVTVVEAFAASVAFPDPAPSDLLADDTFSTQLRASAKEQSTSLGAQGVFTQTHEPGGVLGGFRLKDGKGAIVFASLVRDDAIALRAKSNLTPGKDFVALTGIKTITSEAKLTSNETIALIIPQTGKARIVAAADQLVDGTGR